MIEVDKSKWKRKEHFDFFSQFDDPFFGLVSEIDCTIAYKLAKEKSYPFFAYYLHKSLQAANQVEEFRFRIEKDKVIIYDEIHASPTIGRNDETFAFSFIKYDSDFNVFNKSLKKEIEDVQNSEGLRFNKETERKDVIHYSSIPWISFTGLTHARNFKVGDSAPKISFGKIFLKDDKKIMPVSVFAHHGLVDGLHVGKYLDLFENLLNAT